MHYLKIQARAGGDANTPSKHNISSVYTKATAGDQTPATVSFASCLPVKKEII